MISSAMAGLGSGSFRFSNSVNNKKSYVLVKLTESAHKALDEYLKCKNNCKSQPAIVFNNGNEGEIKIPAANHMGSAFKFTMQNAHDSEGPQGSFESIRQVEDHTLDSLGPLMGIMRIQAKDDSYEKTRQSMANAMLKNGKTCVKELKPNGVVPRHRPTRPQSMVVPPHKKELSNLTPSHFASSVYPTHNGSTNTSSTSPHRTSTGSKPGWNPPAKPFPQNGRKTNEALKKRPLRERIIHLLAHKPMNKLLLWQKLHADGVKECDKRKLMSIVQGIAVLKDNIYHLPKHIWPEVQEDWPFFTEEEKLSVKRNSLLKLSPPARELTASTPSPNCSPNPSPNPSPNSANNSFSPTGAPVVCPPESLKRPREEVDYDPFKKKTRVSNSKRVPPDIRSDSVKKNYSSSVVAPPPPSSLKVPDYEMEPRLSPKQEPELKTSRKSQFNHQKRYPLDKQPRYPERRLDPLSSSSKDNSLMNGHHSPPVPSVSPLSQNNSPKNLSNGSNSKSDAINNYSHSNGLVSQVPEGRRNGLNRRERPLVASNQYMNGVNNVPGSSPESPDSQQENVDVNYELQYPPIENVEQRRRYKIDFQQIYTEYKVLHSNLEKTKLFFKDLDVRLTEHQFGSPEYDRIKKIMLKEYETRQPCFLEKKKRYSYLDEVLKHIKQHVSDYDATHRF